MSDAVTVIGWSNEEAVAGARQYESIVRNAATRTQQIFEGIKPVVASALTGAAALSAGIFKEGFAFNASIGDAEVGIANVLAKFQGLNKEAAKLEAAKAIEAIKKIEPEAAGGLGDLVQGFLATAASAQSAGINVQQNVELVGMFANALSNAAIPAEQLSQEMRSIFTGNIGADSTLAKILQITNAQVEAAKASGNLYGFLKEKIGELGEAGDTTAVTISSLKSAFAELSGTLTQLPFKTAIDGAKELTKVLKDIKDATEQTNFRLTGGGIKDVYSALADEKPGRAIALLEGKISEVRGRINDIKNGEGIAGGIQRGLSHASGELEGLLMLMNEYKSLIVRIRRDEKEFIKTAKAAREEEKRRDDEANRKTEDEAKAKIKALSDVEKLRRQDARNEEVRKLKPDLQSARDETLSLQLNNLEKLEVAKQRLGELDKRLNEARQQQSTDETLRVEIEREKALQQVLILEQTISAEKDNQEKQANDEKKAENEKANRQAESLNNLLKENEILNAKANGRFKEAEALQRQLDILREAARIQQETGKSAEDALSIARERADLAEKAAKKEADRGQEERRIKGFTQDQNKFKNQFRSLDARDASLRDRPFGARQVNTPGLDAFQRLQDRKQNPLGAAFGKQPDRNLLAEKAAANNRGPVDNGALATLGRIEQGINNLTQTFAEAAGV